MSASGTDHISGTSAKISRPSPGPTEWINVSVVYGPPEVEKKRTKTSPSVPIARGSFCLIQLVRKLHGGKVELLLFDGDEKLMIRFGFPDHIGLNSVTPPQK